jgi:hypothetical protein
MGYGQASGIFVYALRRDGVPGRASPSIERIVGGFRRRYDDPISALEDRSMRLLNSLIMALTVTAAVPALADHAAGNAREIARAAYRAADAAEALAAEAYREAQWGGSRDHRPDTLRRFAEEANALHYTLSALYRAAIRAPGPFGARDHSGDGIRFEFERVRRDFYQLGQSYHELRVYQLSPRLSDLYRSVYDTYTRLEWLVYGGATPN